MSSGSIEQPYRASIPIDEVAQQQLQRALSRPQVLPAGVQAHSGSATAVLAPTPAAASSVASAGPSVQALRLVVSGFNAMERGLLEGTVRLSQRRNPPLRLLPDTDIAHADVVMVDARDAQAMKWAREQPLLLHKVVIWVDSGATSVPGHIVVRRPVQWPTLPMMLARAMEQASVQASSSPPVAAPPAPPTAAPATQDVRHAVEPVTAVNAQRPVLIVDDSLAVRAYLRSQLEGRGLRVIEAESAQIAIDLVQRTPFAAVFMDVLMPGIDGYEGCKQIKSRLRTTGGIAVIMLTSKSSPFDRIRGKMAGCDAYLTKPVDPKQLQDVLDQYVLRPPASAGQAQPAAKTPLGIFTR